MRLLGRIARRVGGAIMDAAIGRPAVVGEPRASAPAWAPYRKLIAVPIGAFLGWAATKTGWQWVIDGQEEITTLLIAYLVWRFPNAAPPQVDR